MNYPGSKGGNGVYQTIINHFPPHKKYYELFLGTGEVLRHKQPAVYGDYGIEISPNVIKRAKWKPRLNRFIMEGDAFKMLYYIQGLCKRSKDPQNILIYLDPPYPISSRKSPTPLYENELTDQQHIQLLRHLDKLPCNIAISTYPNDIYSDWLVAPKWNCVSFKTGTRGGSATELLYMNYPKPSRLHQYDFLGKNRTDRQRIKRKIDRHVNKLLKLDPCEAVAICEQVFSHFPSGNSSQK